MTKKQFYTLVFSGITIGVLYLLIQTYLYKPTQSLCLFKAVTTIPCPSCGSTRAVTELLEGNLMAAIAWNPLGIFTFSLMVIITPWAIYDLCLNTETLFLTYKRIEIIVRKQFIAIPLIFMVLANWIWNIYKGL